MDLFQGVYCYEKGQMIDILDKADQDQCQLLGGFAIFIQLVMGVSILGSLIYKRSKEFPHRRPWIIWFYDVSKQIFGSLTLHMINILSSIVNGTVLVKEVDDVDPCEYYFLNIVFDTTIGIPILYYLICIITFFCRKLKITGIQSGEYGNPPKFSNYLKQFLIFILSMILMKVLVFTIMIISLPVLDIISDFILGMLDNYPNIKISFVLLVFPMIMNILQYYIVDNLIQSREYYTSNKQIQALSGEETIVHYYVVDEEIPGSYITAK